MSPRARGAGKMCPPSQACVRACALAWLLAVLACAAQARAADTAPPREASFHLRSGDLATALNDLAAQARIQILYDARLLDRRRARALDGRYGIAAALAQLLRGSGLEAAAVNADTYVVTAAASPRKPPPVAAVEAVPHPLAEVELPRVIVSSADFQRLAAQTVMPVTEITREQIDASGYATLFDLLKAQPGMQVSNEPEAMASSSDASFRTGASGAAAVALRRLGSKGTLFLVDGRRVTGYGLAQDATGTVADLNAIPLAMVERVEILRDGASAVYGSDAIAGVVNVILRRDFSGAQASVYAGVSSRGDAATRQASVSWGGRTDGGTGLFLNLNALHDDALPGSRRAWYSLDQRRQGLPDLRSLYSFPGNLLYDDGSIRAMPGCAPAALDASGACLFDSAKTTTLQNGHAGASMLGRLDAPFGESTRLHLDLRVVDATQRQQAAPSAAGLLLSTLQESLAPQPFELLYSFSDIGAVREATRSLSSSFAAGLGGEAGGFDWSLDASTQRDRVVDRIDGLVRSDVVQLSLDGERYTFGDAPPSPRLRALLAPQAVRKGATRLDALSFDASGDVFAAPAGTAALATGIEVRREGVEQRPGAVLQSGELLNQPAEYPLSRQRTASAAYLKLDVPLLARLDASAAWRIETATGFAPRAAPTFGLGWKPVDALLLRASLSKGWRAPTLQELYQPRSGGPQIAAFVPASARPCAVELLALPGQSVCLLDSSASGNAALRPETSTTSTAGLVWAPSAAFSLSADAYVSKRRNGIGFVSTAYMLLHPELYPGMIERDDGGALIRLQQALGNLADTTTRGLDMEARWSLDARAAGRFELNLGANYLDAFSQRAVPGAPPLHGAGYLGMPRLTAVSTLRWTRGDWIAAANLRYVGSYQLEQYAHSGIGCAAPLAEAGKCAVPPFTLANANVTWSGLPHWSFTLGVNNLFDHQPRYYDASTGGYSAALDDVLGRYYTFRGDYRF